MFESFEDCAIREVVEETGLELDRETVIQVHVSNDIFQQENKHYVTIAMMAQVSRKHIEINRRPENLEPDKCLGWKSYSWDELSDIFYGKVLDVSLFPSLEAIVKARPPIIIHTLSSSLTR